MIIADLLIGFLLMVTLYYCYMLHRKIIIVQNSREELLKLFKYFDHSLTKAQDTIVDLKKISEDADNGLQQKIDKAISLVSELDLMNSRAEVVVEKLNSGLGSSKSHKIVKTASQVEVSDEVNNKNNPENFENKKTKILNILNNLALKRGDSAELNTKSEAKNRADKSASILKALGYGSK